LHRINEPGADVNLRAANVWFKEAVAGVLQETARGGTRFVYNTEWHTPIACCLPSERREHEWASGLHPFFQHLGPEGWLRQKQARVAHIAEEDDFGLLLRFGADCIGAVSVRSSTPYANDDPLTEDSVNRGRTISGVQRKLLVVKKKGLYAPAADTGPAPYIAKFNSESIPTLVRNEALSLRWATAMLGEREVTKFALGQIAETEEIALIVTRFDRTRDGEKLRLEDFAQILCKPRGQDYGGKYDASYEDVAGVIKAYSSRPEIDLARFFGRLILFALIGNCDAHLKNFSLLETPTGLRLSPLYDVVNTVVYDGYEQTLALRINGRHVPLESVTLALLEEFGRSIGLPKRAIDQIFADLLGKARKATSVLRPPTGEGPDGFITRFGEIVSGACLRILGEYCR
jgi:serine/threonine-protein kinase HipA